MQFPLAFHCLSPLWAQSCILRVVLSFFVYLYWPCPNLEAAIPLQDLPREPWQEAMLDNPRKLLGELELKHQSLSRESDPAAWIENLERLLLVRRRLILNTDEPEALLLALQNDMKWAQVWAKSQGRTRERLRLWYLEVFFKYGMEKKSSEYEKALLELQAQLKESEDYEFLAYTKIGLVLFYYEKTRKADSLLVLRDLLQWASEEHKLSFIAGIDIANCLSDILYKEKSYDKSLAIDEQTYKICGSDGPAVLCSRLAQGIAMSLIRQSREEKAKVREAEPYLHDLAAFAERLHQDDITADLYYTRMKYFLALRQLKNARAEALLAQKVFQTLGYRNWQQIIIANLGYIAVLEAHFAEAVSYFDSFDNTEFMDFVGAETFAESAIQAYQKTGHQDKVKTLTSLLNALKQKRELEEQKQAYQNSMNTLALDIEEKRAQLLKAEVQLERQRFVIGSILALFLISIIAGLLYWHWQRQRARATFVKLRHEQDLAVERAISATTQRLESDLRLKFVASAAHSLNNPMNFIHLGVDALDQGHRELQVAVTTLLGAEPAADPDLRACQQNFSQLFAHFEQPLQEVREGLTRSRLCVEEMRALSGLDGVHVESLMLDDLLRAVKSRLRELRQAVDFVRLVFSEAECQVSVWGHFAIYQTVLEIFCDASLDASPEPLACTWQVEGDKGLWFAIRGKMVWESIHAVALERCLQHLVKPLGAEAKVIWGADGAELRLLWSGEAEASSVA